MNIPVVRDLEADARATAVSERQRNVVIDAGAGTGKTTLLVERFVELLAPRDDGDALRLERLAAITFTRRAAGELRLRIRARLLEELAPHDVSSLRCDRLRAGLASIDSAHIGTVHSFADRLLRLRPLEAALGPAYEVVDDRSALVEETARRLLLGASHGSLAARVGLGVPPELVHEATLTILDALEVGIRSVRRETEFWIDHGIDSLVRGFVEQRDVGMPSHETWEPDPSVLLDAFTELRRVADQATGDAPVASWLRRLADRLPESGEVDLLGAYRDVAAEIHQRRRPSAKFNLRDGCRGDRRLWQLWNRVDRDGPGGPALGDVIVTSLHRWMASRLLHIRPVVLAVYEETKRQRGVLDEIDLLMRLRDLLRDDVQSRAFYQARFDHIFVDEFQDTDPLQAEILLYLSERGVSGRVEDIVPAPGTLTIVGDPQQSIYRFRRADIGTYARVCERLESTALRVELTRNFRSSPMLVEWANERFGGVFGRAPSGVDDGVRFDSRRGRVFHRDLRAARTDGVELPVHVVPLESADEHNADGWRAEEARALPRYLRWLVERSEVTVRDGETGAARRIGWGDICVLAMSTFHLPLLFNELDALSIPYSASGSTLFLDDPLLQRFILALRGLADPTDGPAAAALRLPPMFGIDPGRIALARGGIDVGGRVAAMEQAIADLRRHRFRRTAGETARALLETTDLGSSVAIGPGGAERLDRLRELCHLADVLARTELLDYDGVTAKMRAWIDQPVSIDAPPHVLPRALRVMTIHQAKGLEFPVVVLWDARARAEIQAYPTAWQSSVDGQRWTMRLDGLYASQPVGTDLGAVERTFFDEERRRLSYVAVTRARDLVVAARAGKPEPSLLWRPLLSDTVTRAVHVSEPWIVGRGAAWADDGGAVVQVEPRIDGELEASQRAKWSSAVVLARRSLVRSSAVTSAVRALPRDRPRSYPESTADDDRGGRHGPGFGTAVHRALGMILADRVEVDEAVSAAASGAAVPSELQVELAADVRRALSSLRELGVVADTTLRVEYPVAGTGADASTLLIGAIDLLVLLGDTLWVIDFKTDRPPVGDALVALPAYAAQVSVYVDLLARAGVQSADAMRCALLFTADGSLHEIEHRRLAVGGSA